MKILIIGSKGFIGSHVLQWFAAQPQHAVWGADIIADYTDPNYYLLHAQQPDFDALFRAQPFDVCINCSGAAHVPDSFVHTARDFALNVANVAAMLEAIRQHAPQCRFINLGSAAVYGNPSVLPVPEDSPLRPLSPYGYHKQYAEQLCAQYHALYGLHTVSLRLFSAYGPGLRKQLFWDLHRKMQSDTGIRLWGTGNESRDFIYVTDIARALDTVIQRGRFDAGLYNVASGAATTIADAAALFAGLMDWQGSIQFGGEERTGDPLHWQADINRISALGWQPATPLAQGLKNYLDWLEKE